MREPDVDPQVITQYPGFIVNKLLSYHQDCVLVVNAINKLSFLDTQLQYEFLLHALPKKKRYSKLHKGINPENLDLLKEYYGYSTAKAMEVLALHSEEDFDQMRECMAEGGVIREKSSRNGRDKAHQT